VGFLAFDRAHWGLGYSPFYPRQDASYGLEKIIFNRKTQSKEGANGEPD
jgi:hypothetical protein